MMETCRGECFAIGALGNRLRVIPFAVCFWCMGCIGEDFVDKYFLGSVEPGRV